MEDCVACCIFGFNTLGESNETSGTLATPYYKVVPKLLQRPDIGIATERMYSLIINKAEWNILIM